MLEVIFIMKSDKGIGIDDCSEKCDMIVVKYVMKIVVVES